MGVERESAIQIVRGSRNAVATQPPAPATLKPRPSHILAFSCFILILELKCLNVLFNRIIAIARRPMASAAAWRPRMGAPYWPAVAPGAAKSSRSATKGSFPFQVSRNVSACCDRRISEEFMTKGPAFPVPSSPLSVCASRRSMDPALDLQHPGRSAKLSRVTASGGVSAKPCGFSWIG